jgi:hypothetical protein
MDERMTDLRMLDLYEEMLYERAAKGLRPVLYVSSRKDLECSVLMLMDEAPEVQLSGRGGRPREESAITLGQISLACGAVSLGLRAKNQNAPTTYLCQRIILALVQYWTESHPLGAYHRKRNAEGRSGLPG